MDAEEIYQFTIAELEESVRIAYRERAMCVAAFSRIWPSKLTTDVESIAPFQTVVMINGPRGQMGWHVHQDDLDLFRHLPHDDSVIYDGHSTEEKYNRLQVSALQAGSAVGVADAILELTRWA